VSLCSPCDSHAHPAAVQQPSITKKIFVSHLRAACECLRLMFLAGHDANVPRQVTLLLACASHTDLSSGPEASAPTFSRRRRREETPPDGDTPSKPVRLTEPRTPLESGRQCNWCQRCLGRLATLSPGVVVSCDTSVARTR
jgi:hypothetical protein